MNAGKKIDSSEREKKNKRKEINDEWKDRVTEKGGEKNRVTE